MHRLRHVVAERVSSFHWLCVETGQAREEFAFAALLMMTLLGGSGRDANDDLLTRINE